MRRLSLLALLSALGLSAVLAAPAGAITGGTPDGDDHPFVALMVAQGPDGELLGRCSGTLLSPTVYLTAGHCTDGATDVELFFDEGHIPLGAGFPAEGDNPCAGVSGYPCTGDVHGTPSTHPDFDAAAFYLADLGVVVLDEPVELEEYGELPAPGLLDDAKPSKTTFTAVGYGMQKSYPDAASWKNQEARVRLVAHPRLVKMNTKTYGPSVLVVSTNSSTGGTCFGDSGGPYFLEGSNVIVGVTSFNTNSNCSGGAGVYRIDHADALDWLATEFGVVP